MKSLDLGNLGGTLYYKEIPLFEFKFNRDGSVTHKVINDDLDLYPFEMRFGEINANTITRFFNERITPSTRIGLDEVLANSPIKYYHPERIIRYSSGRCIHDPYWLKCNDDNSCWED